MSIQLSHNRSFDVEDLGKRCRLIIQNSEEELACRKEYRRKLYDFLSQPEGHLFKGRLQLKKEQNLIHVYLKNECIGSISSTQLEEYL